MLLQMFQKVQGISLDTRCGWIQKMFTSIALILFIQNRRWQPLILYRWKNLSLEVDKSVEINEVPKGVNTRNGENQTKFLQKVPTRSWLVPKTSETHEYYAKWFKTIIWRHPAAACWCIRSLPWRTTKVRGEVVGSRFTALRLARVHANLCIIKSQKGAHTVLQHRRAWQNY